MIMEEFPSIEDSSNNKGMTHVQILDDDISKHNSVWEIKMRMPQHV